MILSAFAIELICDAGYSYLGWDYCPTKAKDRAKLLRGRYCCKPGFVAIRIRFIQRGERKKPGQSHIY